MPERGTQVALPGLARLLVRGLGYFTWPLRIDDYLELITPLWSVEERRGRIERVHRETDDAVTVFITPGFRWVGHQPGQYVRIGFDVEGKRYWRAYSLSSDAARPDGQVTITVKRTDDGVVSRFLNSSQAAGSIVTLGDVEGEFTLPSPTPQKLLFLTAGSGVTPVMAMLRALSRQGDFPDVLHIHSARAESEAIFAADLAALAERNDRYRVRQLVTGEAGRLKPDALDDVCPDWRERQTFACGPGAMLDGLREHFASAGIADRLHMESFEHMLLAEVTGKGGSITFSGSGITAECDGSTAILDAGENAGATLPYGCRMGICHTCTGTLSDGSVRDLRTGDVTRAGTEIRTCVNSPDGDVTIEL
ncbi:ferredoxin reductase [Mycolicibacterium hodleri]|uniref:Ferredoxin reductase n=1 Tax=Mycolicibacterium hodleri TaxID=49897 RepID=A0A502E4T7_9MYCO|nr:ferredoxin reductase [Mycolicibacterium hodleri]TPG31969.1 ferredoxin reductase [Mycolicibacterium hodleri]